MPADHLEEVRVAATNAAAIRALTPPAPADNGEPPLTIVYTNWRGETAERAIIPLRMWFGSTEWHKEPQWLLTALDVEKKAERDFAWAGIDFQGDGPATPPPIEDVAEPSESEALDEESILDVISGNLRMESWVAGKTLTVMFDAESGERRFAKLRLTKIAAHPSAADLKGEPE